MELILGNPTDYFPRVNKTMTSLPKPSLFSPHKIRKILIWMLMFKKILNDKRYVKQQALNGIRNSQPTIQNLHLSLLSFLSSLPAKFWWFALPLLLQWCIQTPLSPVILLVAELFWCLLIGRTTYCKHKVQEGCYDKFTITHYKNILPESSNAAVTGWHSWPKMAMVGERSDVTTP